MKHENCRCALCELQKARAEIEELKAEKAELVAALSKLITTTDEEKWEPLGSDGNTGFSLSEWEIRSFVASHNECLRDIKNSILPLITKPGQAGEAHP